MQAQQGPIALILAACGSSGGADNAPAGSAGNAPQSTAAAGSADSQGAADGMIEKLDLGGFGGGSNPQVNYNPYSPRT